MLPSSFKRTHKFKIAKFKIKVTIIDLPDKWIFTSRCYNNQSIYSQKLKRLGQIAVAVQMFKTDRPLEKNTAQLISCSHSSL